LSRSKIEGPASLGCVVPGSELVRQKGEGRREGRREKGEGRREKGEGRREKGEGRREKGEGRRRKKGGSKKEKKGIQYQIVRKFVAFDSSSEKNKARFVLPQYSAFRPGRRNNSAIGNTTPRVVLWVTLKYLTFNKKKPYLVMKFLDG
jgi:hypothetical protein